jgi:hypothetical protein
VLRGEVLQALTLNSLVPAASMQGQGRHRYARREGQLELRA